MHKMNHQSLSLFSVLHHRTLRAQRQLVDEKSKALETITPEQKYKGRTSQYDEVVRDFFLARLDDGNMSNMGSNMGANIKPEFFQCS